MLVLEVDYAHCSRNGRPPGRLSGSADLYRKIEGWATASMEAVAMWALF
jgi:hypothetical protein